MGTMISENGLYIGLAVLGVVGLAIIYLNGWLMKLAVRICGGDDIGTFYGLSVLSMNFIATIAVSAVFVFLLPKQNPFLVFCCGFGAVILVMCVMLHMGPIRALGVYLLHGLMSGLLIFAICIVAIVALKMSIPSEQIEQYAAKFKTEMEKQQQRSSSVLGDEAPGNDPQWDVVLSLLGGGDVEPQIVAEQPIGDRVKEPVTTVDFSALDQLEELLWKKKDDVGEQPDSSVDQKNHTPTPPAIPQVIGTVRSNPYANN